MRECLKISTISQKVQYRQLFIASNIHSIKQCISAKNVMIASFVLNALYMDIIRIIRSKL